MSGDYMEHVENAKKVIRILKKNGYEAYMVGGCVRDKLLKMPISDIDITTNAKPTDVMKIFKTIPTGLKYGTVTVQHNESKFEVTTYRMDENYTDFRHPDKVIYSTNVLDDVHRRDFTMNALLLDEHGNITDHVNGIKDIKSGIIRAIGDPKERFKEDALRMLRAFYFQSKLGFDIDSMTMDAIKEVGQNIEHVSKERVLDEIMKMLKGKHLKKALNSMVESNIIQYLDGLEKGIKFIATLDEMPFTDAFFGACFVLNKEVPQTLPFSNKHRHKYQQVIELVDKYQIFDNVALYTYGLELCLLANKVSFILGKAKYAKKQIADAYEALPIKSDLDLKLRASDIMKLLDRKAGAWLGELQREMVLAILNDKVQNTKEALEAYVLSHQ